MNVRFTEGQLIERSVMKTRERINYGFENEQNLRRNYAFTSDDYRIQQVRNQNFVVPWQMTDKVEKEVVTD